MTTASPRAGAMALRGQKDPAAQDTLPLREPGGTGTRFPRAAVEARSGFRRCPSGCLSPLPASVVAAECRLPQTRAARAGHQQTESTPSSGRPRPAAPAGR